MEYSILFYACPDLLFCLCRRAVTERIWPIWQLYSFADCWKRPYQLPSDTSTRDRCRYRRSTRPRKVGPWSSPARQLSTVWEHHRRIPFSVDPKASRRPARNPRRSIATAVFEPVCLSLLANWRTGTVSLRLGCRRRSTVARTLRPIPCKGDIEIRDSIFQGSNRKRRDYLEKQESVALRWKVRFTFSFVRPIDHQRSETAETRFDLLWKQRGKNKINK